MKERITIQNATITESKILLETKESINGLVPAEQLLVDSARFSFIYLMENQEDYTYIALPEQIWPFLKTALEQNLPVLLSFNDEQIELINFHDELEFLVSNIKGNSNYGNDMVTKVEGNF